MGNSTTTIPKQEETIEVSVIDSLGTEDVLEDDSLKENCSQLLITLTIFMICLTGTNLIASNVETITTLVIYIIS